MERKGKGKWPNVQKSQRNARNDDGNVKEKRWRLRKNKTIGKW